jgi:hypothetical protein
MSPSEPDESKQKEKTPNFTTRIEMDIKKFGDKGGNIRDEYRGSFYCCIGFSLTFEARDYGLGIPHPSFVTVSTDQLAQHAARWGLVDVALADRVPDDDLMMWWSRLYVKAWYLCCAGHYRSRLCQREHRGSTAEQKGSTSEQ